MESRGFDQPGPSKKPRNTSSRPEFRDEVRYDPSDQHRQPPCVTRSKRSKRNQRQRLQRRLMKSNRENLQRSIRVLRELIARTRGQDVQEDSAEASHHNEGVVHPNGLSWLHTTYRSDLNPYQLQHESSPSTILQSHSCHSRQPRTVDSDSMNDLYPRQLEYATSNIRKSRVQSRNIVQTFTINTANCNTRDNEYPHSMAHHPKRVCREDISIQIKNFDRHDDARYSGDDFTPPRILPRRQCRFDKTLSPGNSYGNVAGAGDVRTEPSEISDYGNERHSVSPLSDPQMRRHKVQFPTFGADESSIDYATEPLPCLDHKSSTHHSTGPSTYGTSSMYGSIPYGTGESSSVDGTNGSSTCAKSGLFSMYGPSEPSTYWSNEASTHGPTEPSTNGTGDPLSTSREREVKSEPPDEFSARGSVSDFSPPASHSRRTQSVVALDCEMVGCKPDHAAVLASLIGRRGKRRNKIPKEVSVAGRCTIVDYHGNVLYDSYIRPNQPITSLRTLWSGITAKDMIGATPIDKARLKILEILRGKIVVAHNIEHDLNALSITLPAGNIRDTSCFPPLLRLAGIKSPGNASLKTLARSVLGREIQRGMHCSRVDAQTTMELYHCVEDEWEKTMATF